MKKNYKRNASRAAMSEIEVPDAMGELTGAMREGLADDHRKFPELDR